MSEITIGDGKPGLSSTATLESTITVMDYGAIGDGKTDDSKAFLSAWEAACSNTGTPTVAVPSGKSFLISQAEFQGPCQASNITFQILGAIIAPTKQQWTSNFEGWIRFTGVNGLHIAGNGQGSFNGQGQSWWSNTGDKRPSAIRFSKCDNLKVTGLKHENSQKNHLSVTNCNHAEISGLEMTAPDSSPNTDGIDISSSTYIIITNCTFKTGDDCIAINGGCSNVHVSDVNCGPGHGISIGSLGENGEHEEVETISVDKCNFYGTTNGARIKTWQGGSGFARNINFTNLNFTETENPVIIDQFYCPEHNCPPNNPAVKISDVQFRGLYGTSSCKTPTINIKCSEKEPCTNIQLEDVNIKSADPKCSATAECINTIGTIAHTSSPLVNCSTPSTWQKPTTF
ncbi:probable polygalacturonase At3g15720 [Andrographis paniculata]|uniref:probable polygalacturonase At3g15720 n=1 Tax=Andrographis paniculata TaxID=175694 RepID=UPI0021E8488E|nr:probable polygalacturonase At3g15720 [Andrographis paniculata]